MKNANMSPVILFILISCSNSYAAHFQSDLEMTDPNETLKMGQQWLKDDASTGICAAEIRDYNFCLNTTDSLNVEFECYDKKMQLKNCWDNHWRMVERNCQMFQKQYYFNIDSRNFQMATKNLENAEGCDWQKKEKQKIRYFRCNNNGKEFGRYLSDSNYDQCKRILRDSRDCDWHEKGSNDLYSDMRGPDLPSVANPRPTYSAGVLLDTLLISSESPQKTTSHIILSKEQVYIIKASGVFGAWRGKSKGLDAVWCYAKWRWGEKGTPCNQLQIDGQGMTNISGQIISYNPSHVYQIKVRGKNKPMTFWLSDAQSSFGDNKGEIKVEIYK